MIRKLPKIAIEKGPQEAFSLLEVLIVLSIVATTFMMVAYGVIKFRQVIVVSNATKEYVLNLRKARRYAINNVVTSGGYSPQSYYIQKSPSGDSYYWGEVSRFGDNGLLQPKSQNIQSEQYTGVSMSGCKSNTTYDYYNVIKFMAVTGEFVFVKKSNASDIRVATPDNAPTDVSCTISIGLKNAFIDTKREIEVNGRARTIKIK